MIFIWILFIGDTTTCFDVSLVSLISTNAGYGWELGPCSFELQYVGDQTYTEMCCISPGQHTLICKASNRFGWKKSFLIINGHRFCDDFTSYKAMRTINVTGCTYLI